MSENNILSAIRIVFNTFFYRDKYQFLSYNLMLNQRECLIFCPKLVKYDFFHPLQVVRRGSEAQLEVGENVELKNSAKG